MRKKLTMSKVSRACIGLALSMGIASVAMGASAAGAAGSEARAPKEKGAATVDWLAPKEIESLGAALAKISSKYVDEIPSKEFLKLVMDGIASKLDAHTAYMDPEEVRGFERDMSQSFAGVGLALSGRALGKSGGLRVEEVLEGGPAGLAGVLEGDLVRSVDGKPMGPDVNANAKMLEGAEGAPVKLSIERAGSLVELEFARKKIEPPSAFGAYCECSGAHAYFLRVQAFRWGTAAEAAGLLERAQKSAPKAIVLDLRDNPGGSLGAAVELSSLFLKDGSMVVSERGRSGRSLAMGVFSKEQAWKLRSKGASVEGLAPAFGKYRAELWAKWPELASMPIYALVDSGTASAGEIVAAALRDNGRALLIGERTFGKGSVQEVLGLPNGGAMKLTTARYYTPSGSSIQAVGVRPDAEVVDARPWRSADLERRRSEFMKDAPAGPRREKDLPRSLSAASESSAGLGVAVQDEKRPEAGEASKMPEAAGELRIREPYERQLSYAPMGADGKPDPATAKALELAKMGVRPKPLVDPEK